MNTEPLFIAKFPLIFNVPPVTVKLAPLSTNKVRLLPPVVPMFTVPLLTVTTPPVLMVIPLLALDTIFTVAPLTAIVPSLIMLPPLFKVPAEAVNVAPVEILNPLQTAVYPVGIVTLTPVAIVALLLIVGIIPFSQVAVLFQLPVAMAIIVGDSGLTPELVPIYSVSKIAPPKTLA